MNFTFNLIVLVPSEALALKLGSIKKKIYTESGIISAIALPSIIPVKYVDQAIQKKDLSHIHITRQSIELCKAPICFEGNWFLPLKQPEAISSIFQAAGDFESSKQNFDFIPEYPGFFLAGKELVAPSESFWTQLTPMELPLFSDFRIELMQFTLDSQSNWWENIFMGTIWSYRLKLE